MPLIFKMIVDALPAVGLRITEFCFTLWLIRYAGHRLRRLIRPHISRHNSIGVLATLHVAPSILVAALALLVERLGLAFLSSHAAVVSLALDGLNLIGAGLWWLQIVMVGRKWVHTKSPIVCVENQSSSFLASGYTTLLRVIAGRRIEVPPREFAKHFGRNYRRLADIELHDPKAFAIVGVSSDEALEMPHWCLGIAEIQHVEQVPIIHKSDVNTLLAAGDFRASPTAIVRGIGEALGLVGLPESGVPAVARVQNMKLYEELPDHLWAASCAICHNMPRLIAAQWQTFHFQTTLSLRFLTLLNTMDLLQRYIGTIILVTLRSREGLPSTILKDNKFLSRGTFGEWNKIIETALQSSDPILDEWRLKLLTDRIDFPELLDSLAPLWALLGSRVQPSSLHTLSAWRILGLLRNEFVGHGTLGLGMAIVPMKFISALHSYFLHVVAEAVQGDLGIAIFSEGSHKPCFDRGFKNQSSLDPNSWIGIRLENGGFQSLLPYFLAAEGRILVLNRLFNGYADYVDFGARNAFEPSFVRREMPSEHFKSLPNNLQRLLPPMAANTAL